MSSNHQQNSQQYTAQNIKVLTPREHIRLRPGMYVGGTDKHALFNLLDIALDYGIELIANGNASEISVCFYDNRMLEVQVDDIDEKFFPYIDEVMGISGLEAVMTLIFCGCNRNNRYFPVSGGMHGIGLQALNCLADSCIVELSLDGDLWRQTYKTGISTSPVEKVGQLPEYEPNCTSFTCIPDYSIFDDVEVEYTIVAQRFEDLAYIFPNARFTVRDMRGTDYQETYHFKNGLVDWIKQKADSDRKVHYDVISTFHIQPMKDKWGNHYEIAVDLAFQYVDKDVVIVRSFVNSAPVPNGGTHLDGLQKAICACIWEEGEATPDWETVGRGFVGMMSIFHPDPQFESQTRIKVLNPDIEFAVIEAVKEAFCRNPGALAEIRRNIRRRLQ